MKYLTKTGKHTWHLDHRLVPEVRAMLAAMSSRMPVGGLVARYTEVVDAVLKSGYPQPERYLGDRDWVPTFGGAEETLCEYPLHPKVQEFFDKFVGAYGHSSILELTGSPTVYSDNMSWWAAYLLFDSPLVCGQENSTRAVTRKGWPMARECYLDAEEAEEIRDNGHVEVGSVHPLLAELDQQGMAIFEAEVDAWKVELQLPCLECTSIVGKGLVVRITGVDCPTCNNTGKKYPWMKDPQAFRPALDRARWALPGTISTGAAFASHVRDRSRAIKDGLAFAQGSPQAVEMFEEIKAAYQAAVPGIGALGLREAVYAADKLVEPEHLQVVTNLVNPLPVRSGGVRVNLDLRGKTSGVPRSSSRSYADPSWNYARVDTTIQCSVAVARDWHRHRTFYPWTFRIVSKKGGFLLDSHYEPISDLGKEQIVGYFELARTAFDYFVSEGDHFRAMLCLPFGASVRMSASAGLRDFLYTAHLRAHSHGANFEYEEQAKLMLASVVDQLGPDLCETLKVVDPKQ